MRQEPTIAIATDDDDPASLTVSLSVTNNRRRLAMMFGAVAILAYLVALIATIPARLLIDPGPAWKVGGTVWRGQAVLAAVHRLDWTWSPLRTVGNLAFSADWRMSGGNSDLAGTAQVTPTRMILKDVSGDMAWPLVAALAPRFPLICDMRMRIAMPLLVKGGMAQRVIGTVRADAGRCAVRGMPAADLPVPALSGRVSPVGGATKGWVVPGGSGRKLLTASLSPQGRLRIDVTSAGLAILPMAQAFRYDDNW